MTSCCFTPVLSKVKNVSVETSGFSTIKEEFKILLLYEPLSSKILSHNSNPSIFGIIPAEINNTKIPNAMPFFKKFL